MLIENPDMVTTDPVFRINLHNHSLFSDGKYPVNTLIEHAINANIQLLGISDHSGTSKTHSLPLSKITQYEKLIRTIGEHYKDKIKVIAGIEIDSVFNFSIKMFAFCIFANSVINSGTMILS